MTLAFSSKAQTLVRLASQVQTARIAPMMVFTVGSWIDDHSSVLVDVRERLEPPYIVRSSSGLEDRIDSSNAGRYLSVLAVDAEGLADAVTRVIDSFGQASRSDEVLVQPMLRNVVRSGVAFSHDPNTCTPYRVISWIEGTDTTAVTSGAAGRTWQQAVRSPFGSPEALRPILALVDEVQLLTGGIPVDVEFACTFENGSEVLWLLQARPLVLPRDPEDPSDQATRLTDIQERVERGMRPHPFLMGSRTVFGVMPDWNPAEIVGVRPKPLALSLYRDLVTDSIWAYQRHNYGYRNLRSFPLMPHFYGLPYIDVRLSFNSFIPADLDEVLAGRLVDHYVSELLAQPALHDKVEFEIVYSCYTLDLPDRLQALHEHGFSAGDVQELADSLRHLTNRIIHPESGLWRSDAARLATLVERRERLLASDSDVLERIYWLLEDGKRYGTLPFAGLARAGFVAVQLLRSLVEVGILSSDDYESFLGSVSTVSGQLANDRASLDQATFLARYGHLRPGTYDILSPRYDARPDLYFDWDQTPIVRPEAPPFSLTLSQLRALGALLDEHGLSVDPVGLLTFIQSGIELREFGKFQFSRNLSDAIALIAQYGRSLGFSSEDMAYADIAEFRELYVGVVNPREAISQSIQRGRDRYTETLRTALPPLITSPADVWGFEWPVTLPNFITQKAVVAPVAHAEQGSLLDGAIVCIPSADPGYDWLFSYPIAGLVTAWGGANSHMAIRAGELGLPAVVGAGEVAFGAWAAARRLRIDCASRTVEILS